MTSKSLFFKLMREDIKRRVWAVGLAFLSMFFSMPVAAAMGIGSLAKRYERWLINGTGEAGMTAEMLRNEQLLNLVEEILGLQNFVMAFVIGTAAVVLGLTGFMFLHSKKQMDFYHSIPIRRETLFSVKYLDGFLIILSMYFLNMVFAAGIFAANGVPAGQFLPGMFTTFAVHMTGFLLIYSVMVIAVLLTGNFFISVVGGIVLYSYIPALIMLIQGLMSMFFVTMDDRNLKLYRWILNGSPISYYGSMVGKGASQSMLKNVSDLGTQAGVILESGSAGYGILLKDMGIGLLAVLILTAIALMLYKRRPSEAAGKAMAFSVTKAPIKIMIVVPITIMMTMLFWNIYFSFSWAVFGFVLGLVLTHCIIEIIYHFEFRKLFSNPVHMAVCAVLSLAVIGVFRYDVVGYDRYIPDENEFSSASISSGTLNDWMDYGLPERLKSGYRWKYMNQADYAAEQMAVTDYEAVRAIAESAVKNAKAEKENKLRNLDMVQTPGFWMYMEVGYRLENGRQVYRRYHVNLADVREAMDAIYESEEYKKGVYPVMDFAADNITGLYEAGNGKIKEVEADKDLRDEILRTYKKELAELSLKERETAVPVVLLRFLTEAERDYLEAVTKTRYMTEMNGFKLEAMEQVNFFPVYPSFTETIGLLRKAGVNVEGEIPLGDVKRIEIDHYYREEKAADGVYPAQTYEQAAYEYADKEYGPEMGKIIIENDGTPENTKKLQELLKLTVPTDLSEMNRLRTFEYGFTLRVYLKSANEGKHPSEEEWTSFVFQGLEIPEFLSEAVHYDRITGKNINYGIAGEK